MVDPMSPAALANRLEIDAVLCERDALRFTPAGIAMLTANVRHESRQMEASHARTVEFELQAVFAGAVAERADRLPLGRALHLAGFIAPRRRGGKVVALHVNEFLEIDS